MPALDNYCKHPYHPDMAAEKVPVLIRLPADLKAELDALRDLAPMQGYLERVIREHVEQRRAEMAVKEPAP